MAAVILWPAFFAAIFISLQPLASGNNFLAPFFSPIVDDICEASLCGKGTCKVTPNLDHSFPLTCECEPGWKRLIQTYSFQFLPCVIPNCTVNYDCSNVTAPPPEASQAHNQSWFSHEACEFVYCGEGSCLKTNDGHKCVCNNGAYNLLNATHLPCYRECFLGANCAALGFGLGNGPPGVSSRTSPGLSDSTSSATNTQGRSGSSRDLLWLFASVSILVVTPWM